MEKSDMKAMIDSYINEYMTKLVSEPDNCTYNLNALFEKIRVAYNLDMVFLMENDKYVNMMGYTVCSSKNGIPEKKYSKLNMSNEDYNNLFVLYDENLVATTHLDSIGDPDDVLHYGLFINDFYYGCVGFRSLEQREWTEEEKAAIIKVGRAVYFYLMDKRLKKSSNSNKGFSMSETVVSMGSYFVNLKENTCQAFRINSFVKKDVPEYGAYTDFFNLYITKFIDPGFQASIKKKLSIESLRNNLSEKNKSVSSDFRRTEDGVIKWYRACATLSDMDESGRPLHVIINIIDITNSVSERDKNDNAFKFLKDNYYSIFSINLDMDRYSFLSHVDSEYVDNNQISVSYSQMREDVARKYVHIADRENFLKRTSIEYIRARFKISSKPISLRYRRRIKDKFQWIRLEYVINENFSEDNLIVMGYMRDISDEVWEKEEHDRIVNSLGNMYYAVYYLDLFKDSFSKIVSEDATFEKKKIKGKCSTIYDIILKNNVSVDFKNSVKEFANIENISKRMGKEKSISCEFMNTKGKWIKGNFIEVTRDENGVLTHVLFALQHIESEKKKELETKFALQSAFEAAKKANYAKTDFLSKMSHDIRTPMNAIIGMTDIAKSSIDNREKVVNCLEKITISSKHLLDLINEVLDMSKIETGAFKIAEERFSISEIMNKLLEIVGTEIENHKHKVDVNIDIKHDIVFSDAMRLEQILINIMGNAIKYTPDNGTIHICATEKNSRQPKYGCYKFIIEDNGIGMTEEFLKHIFEPFARAEDSRISKIQGTGLGMPIVQNIVKIMNGDIKVKSELGVGSTFEVTLFLKYELDDMKENVLNVKKKPVEENTKIDYSGKKVLLVEDQEFNREIVLEFLEMIGVEAEWAENGRQAYEMFEKSENGYYDLIFMDIQMPILNGYETTEKIRSLGTDYAKNIPIIATTANAFSEDVDTALKSGMNEHISKPISYETLINAIRRWIKGEKIEK